MSTKTTKRQRQRAPFISFGVPPSMYNTAIVVCDEIVRAHEHECACVCVCRCMCVVTSKLRKIMLILFFFIFFFCIHCYNPRIRFTGSVQNDKNINPNHFRSIQLNALRFVSTSRFHSLTSWSLVFVGAGTRVHSITHLLGRARVCGCIFSIARHGC